MLLPDGYYAPIRDVVYWTLAFQFDAGVADALMSLWPSLTPKFSKKKGTLRALLKGKKPFLNYLSHSGRFSLTAGSAKVVAVASEPPRFRVIVDSSVADFIRAGRSAFSKHVRAVDEVLRVGDECLVVDEGDNLLGVGIVVTPPIVMMRSSTGMAVRVRRGFGAGDT